MFLKKFNFENKNYNNINMSLFEDIVNSCIYCNINIKNTSDYIGICVSNDIHQFSYIHKKQKTKNVVVYKKIK